ncbi:hypothetical protein CEE45_17095 [Candidatus Heimdallarchaeota archaeon B3_Heim]|nr:MAG: hypothetical protein CEE45_17095 [Candidatus Heimdallarchaeota archaeon B3_Heim]
MNPEGRVPKEFIAIIVFVLVSVIFIVVPPLNATPLRIIVGFPLVLFLPGYSLICALFPKKNEMDAIERIALSIGLSIAVVVITGLVLSYTPWGIRLGPILLAISSFTLVFAAVTAARRETAVTEHKSIPIDRSTFNSLLLISFYGFLSCLYFSLRYSGLIADGDMGMITKTIQAVKSQATIFTTYQYSSGFGFQVVVTFLSNITDLSIQKLLILPTGFLYLTIAYPLFVELIRDKKIALLATFLLTLQPGLLFFTSRGSHERFIFFLALMTFFILIRLISLKRDDKKFVLYLALFYMTVLSLTSFNKWFSAAIIISMIFACMIGFFFSKLLGVSSPAYKKMSYIVIPCIPIYYSICSYIYPILWVSQKNHINTWKNKLIALHPTSIPLGIATLIIIVSLFLLFIFFKVPIMPALKNLIMRFSEKIRSNKSYRMGIYAACGFGLLTYVFGLHILSISSDLSFPPFIWMFLMLFNWIIFPLSLIMALTIIWDFIQKKNLSSNPLHFLFLFSFYVSFFLLLLITIFLDKIIGTGVANNFELRIFPYFMFFAVALASMIILKWIHQLDIKRWQLTGEILFIILIIIWSINSLVKSTCDPSVSNRWIFYSKEEKIAMNWMESNLKKTTIWAGPLGRVRAAFRYNSNFDSLGNISFSNASNAKYYLISDVARKRANKYKYSLPFIKNSNQIYDNDGAALYQHK